MRLPSVRVAGCDLVHQYTMGDAALEQFCILAKSAKGRAAVQIIAEATSASNLFAFGELLDQPNLKEVRSYFCAL